LSLEIRGYEGQHRKLLVFFVLVVQASDVLQYVWGKWVGRTPIAPTISPGKTWEGVLGGIVSATLLGAGVSWITPFTPWEAGVLSLVLTLLGFAGGLVMSAVKRDRGVKDYGTLIQGHGGILDRIDSICFAAPVFFHLTRYLVASCAVTCMTLWRQSPRDTILLGVSIVQLGLQLWVARTGRPRARSPTGCSGSCGAARSKRGGRRCGAARKPDC